MPPVNDTVDILNPAISGNIAASIPSILVQERKQTQQVGVELFLCVRNVWRASESSVKAREFPGL